jgi:hypothetical protein
MIAIALRKEKASIINRCPKAGPAGLSNITKVRVVETVRRVSLKLCPREDRAEVLNMPIRISLLLLLVRVVIDKSQSMSKKYKADPVEIYSITQAKAVRKVLIVCPVQCLKTGQAEALPIFKALRVNLVAEMLVTNLGQERTLCPRTDQAEIFLTTIARVVETVRRVPLTKCPREDQAEVLALLVQALLFQDLELGP